MTHQRIESFLRTLGLSFDELDSDTWVINDEEHGVENLIVVYEDPVIIFRLKVTDLPRGNHCKLYEELLLLNSTDLLHGAYALEGNSVVLMNTLLSETIDIEEFQATLDAISLSVAEHYERLLPLVKTEDG
jgi:hypothetical protein